MSVRTYTGTLLGDLMTDRASDSSPVCSFLTGWLLTYHSFLRLPWDLEEFPFLILQFSPTYLSSLSDILKVTAGRPAEPQQECLQWTFPREINCNLSGCRLPSAQIRGGETFGLLGEVAATEPLYRLPHRAFLWAACFCRGAGEGYSVPG